MLNRAWTDAENDLIVADYFAMLADDIAGRPYNKAEHYRDLQSRIDRNRSSIAFIVISVVGSRSRKPNLLRRSAVTASVTHGRAARTTPKAPRAASYTT